MLQGGSETPSLSSLSAAPTPRGSDDAGPLVLAVLHEALLALAHGSPQEATLGLLAEKARILTGCASAAVVLMEGDRETVMFAAVSGEDASELLGTRVRASDTVAGNTARTGEPYLAFSPGARPVGNGAATPTRSAAVVPIFENGQAVGALAALNKQGERPFGGDDLLCLSTLAAAAAATLAQHRLRADAHRQGRELGILYDAVRSVAGQLSAQEVLTAVMEQAAAHIENSAVAVFLVNDERTHFYIAADHGLEGDQREVTLPTDSGLGAAAMGTSRPLFLSFGGGSGDEDGYSTAPAYEPPFPGVAARSALVAPIRSGDVAHGVVLAVSGQPDAYSLTDANLLSALTAQAAAAMENAWLYEDAQRRAEEAAALYELSQTITSTLRLETVLDLVADSTLNLLAVDKFALFLRERSTDLLRMVVERGLPEGAPERLQFPVGQGIPGWVVEFETPTAVQDVAADHRNQSAPLHTEGVVSMTCMPLQVGPSTIGVLCAMSSRRRLFTVAEVELLYTIANQAAIAIENARVYADVRQKAQELRKYFHRVARALGSSQSPQEIPQLIATLTMEVMGADRCVLYSLDDEGSSAARLRIEASVNFRPPAEDETAPLREDTPAGWVARRARPLTIEDVAADPRFADRFARTFRGRLGSYLGVPLRRGRDVVGVLEVYTRTPRPWRGDEVRLLLTFASQATVAFASARLAAQSGRAARSAELLRRLLALATAENAPDAGDVARTVGEALETPVVTLEKAADGGVWQVRGAHGLGETEISAVTPRLLDALNLGAPPDGIPMAVSRDGRVALALLSDSATLTREDGENLLAQAVQILTRER